MLARPHPYQRRWYSEYTTTDGRCFVADRVPPCEPAAQPRPAPEDERARHASELDRAAGRAWQRGDLQRAAGLIADARALDPARAHLWAKREAAIAAAAPRSAPSTQAESAGYGRTCNEPHPHQDSYLAARRSVEVGDTGRCHDGHPVSYLRHDVAARLIAAGFTASSPELARIREWNRAALDRAGIRPVGRGQGGGDDMNGQKKLTPSDTVAVLFAARHAQAPGILRSLQDIWVCASAARYGEPYETWQLGDLDAYRTHDLAACEAENDQPARPWDQEGPL